MDHGRTPGCGWQFGWSCLAAACLVGGSICWLGCGSSKPAADEGPKAPAAAQSATKPGQSAAGQPSVTSARPAEEIQAGSAQQVTAQKVLESMVAAYQKAASYADGGQIAFQAQMGEQKHDSKSEFLVAMVRPNKLLLHAYQGGVVCDGKKLSAFIKDLPNQVMQREAPPQLTMESLYSDAILTSALTDIPPQSLAGFPTPLVLLLAKDPLKTLLYRAEKTELLPSDKIGENVCYRVQITRAEGSSVYWIDQDTYVLRRVDYPIEALKQVMAGPVQNLSLVADLRAAQIGTDVDAKAFQFEVPPDAKVREFFAPPDQDLLGKPAPDFEFVDPDGKPVTPKTLAGKVAVLDFWATNSDECRATLPELQEIYRQYKGNDKVAFLAVSADDAKIDDKAVAQRLADWKVDVPIARDLKNTRERLKIAGVPAVVLLGADGKLLHWQSGATPGGSVELAAKLRRTLAGEDVVRLASRQFEEAKAQYLKIVQQWAQADLFVAPPGAQLAMPLPPRSEPASLKMTRLWTCNKLTAPGNVLVVDGDGGRPRILVLDAGTAVVELGADGSVVATTPLKLPPDRLLAALRTALTPEGKRIFVGFNSALPQLYVMDDKFQQTLTFPKDDENPRMGIADVELARLTADGPLVMLVGYWGVAGLQAVSLDGTRLWANKSLDVVSRVAVLGPDSQGRRSLLSTNVGSDGRSVVLVDAQGERKGEIKTPARRIAWLLSADLAGKGQTEICALSPDDAGNITAVGLSVEGKELWAYPLPEGAYDTAVERAVVGNVFPDGPAQWFFPAADGTIHILTADGKLLDRFAYGDRLCGLAMTKLDGHPTLVAATPQAVEAWKIEPMAQRGPAAKK